MRYTRKGYVAREQYPVVPDNYVGFDYTLPHFCNKNYAKAQQRFKADLAQWKQGYGPQDSKYGAMISAFMGMCAQRVGNIQEAIDIFQETLKIDSDRAITYMRLGQCYATLGNHKQALQYYDIVANSPGVIWVASDPMYSALNTDRVFYLRALSRKALNDRDGAIADCNKALAYRNGDYRKAADLLKQLQGGPVNNIQPVIPRGQVKVIEFQPDSKAEVKYVNLMPNNGEVDFSKPKAPNSQQVLQQKLLEKGPAMTSLLQEENQVVRQQGVVDLAYKELLESNDFYMTRANESSSSFQGNRYEEMWAKEMEKLKQAIQPEYDKLAAKAREIREAGMQHLSDLGYSPDQLKGDSFTEKAADMLFDKGLEMLEQAGAISEQVKKNLNFIKEFGYKRIEELEKAFDQFSNGPRP